MISNGDLQEIFRGDVLKDSLRNVCSQTDSRLGLARSKPSILRSEVLYDAPRSMARNDCLQVLVENQDCRFLLMLFGSCTAPG